MIWLTRILPFITLYSPNLSSFGHKEVSNDYMTFLESTLHLYGTNISSGKIIIFVGCGYKTNFLFFRFYFTQGEPIRSLSSYHRRLLTNEKES